MRWPWSKKHTAFEAEFEAVRAIPEPATEQVTEDNWFDAQSPHQQQAIVLPPVEAPNNQTPFAAPPVIDKFPVIIGQNLTGQYVSSAFRLCNMGWRYQYVDLIDELLENDPDARAVVRARMLGIACGRYNVEPAKLPESVGQEARDVAKAVADEYALDFENIPCRTQHIQQLAWADMYGVSGQEIMWEHPDDNRWEISDLSHIHSRRLNYTNPTSWELYVFDQGLVGPGNYIGPTVGVHGLAISQFPGKFLIHTPSLSGQYPTRDGEARYIAFYLLLKRMVVRCSAQDFERVIRPWVIGYFNRQMPTDQDIPFADKKDIAALNQAMGAFGSGSMNWAALPNSVKVELLKQVATLDAEKFLAFLNRSIAKALLGQAFTTEPGPNGNMATAQVADKNTTKILTYSANCMCDTLRRDLSSVWLRLNHPNLPRAFAPRHVVNVEDLPTPKELMSMAKDATGIDMPVDLRDLAQRTTLVIASQDDPDALRSRMVSAQYGPNPLDDDGESNRNEQSATPPEGEDNSKTNGQVKKKTDSKPNGKTNGKAAAAAPNSKQN